jgi:hypothetical protein
LKVRQTNRHFFFRFFAFGGAVLGFGGVLSARRKMSSRFFSASELAMRRKDYSPNSDESKLASLLGRTSLEWSALMFEVSRAFVHVSGLSLSRADAIFYAVRDDLYRISIVAGLISHYKRSPKRKAFLTEIMARIDTIRARRNGLIHTLHVGFGSMQHEPAHMILFMTTKTSQLTFVTFEELRGLVEETADLRLCLASFCSYPRERLPALPGKRPWQPATEETKLDSRRRNNLLARGAPHPSSLT